MGVMGGRYEELGGPVRTATLDTTPVDLATAAAIEAAEARAWRDMFKAVPPDFAAAAGVRFREVAGALVISWAASGRRYFSRAIGLGVAEPVTDAALDDIIGAWERAGIEMFLLQSQPHCRPAEYEGWLRQRRLEPFDAQDRIVRDGRPAAPAPPLEYDVARVTRESADEWAEFVQRVYRLDTGAWLQALVDRPGWHHYVARDGGEIAAARSMYIGPGGTAWLGIDGPVPGVHWSEYGPDTALCTFIVEDGLALGASGFIADIEAPSDDMDTPAYELFARLGFSRTYVRTHYARP
jgi:hypothetical protein